MVTDSMPREFYIPAENIEAMFNDEKWGPYLNIDISSVTLCEKPEKQHEYAAKEPASARASCIKSFR